MSGQTSGRALLVATAVGLLMLALAPARAAAHLVTTGLGPVYDGIGHFALTPEDFVPALALALLAGLRGPDHGRWALFVLPAAWLVGGMAGLTSAMSVSPPAPWLAFVCLGGLVAADARLPLSVTTALAALLGLGHGFLNGAALVRPGPGGAGLVGVVAAVFVSVALAASVVAPVRAAWARLIVRVIGSWVVAVGLLLLGWSFRSSA